VEMHGTLLLVSCDARDNASSHGTSGSPVVLFQFVRQIPSAEGAALVPAGLPHVRGATFARLVQKGGQRGRVGAGQHVPPALVVRQAHVDANALMRGLVEQRAEQRLRGHPVVRPPAFQTGPLQEDLAAAQPPEAAQPQAPVFGRQVHVAAPELQEGGVKGKRRRTCRQRRQGA